MDCTKATPNQHPACDHMYQLHMYLKSYAVLLPASLVAFPQKALVEADQQHQQTTPHDHNSVSYSAAVAAAGA